MTSTRLTIYGSCVARDIVRITEDRFVLNDYVARQNLISAFSNPVSYPDDWGIKSNFQVRSLEGDFASNAAEKISAVADETDVLLLDLASERHGIYEIPDGGYVSATPTQRNAPGVRQIEGLRWIKFGTPEHETLFRSAATELKELLTSLNLFSRTYILKFDFTDRLAEGGSLEKKVSAVEINEKHLPYYGILDDLGFKSIPALPDDLCFTTNEHKWGASQDHYVDAAYEWWADQIDLAASNSAILENQL